jgi:hypothetical protein
MILVGLVDGARACAGRGANSKNRLRTVDDVTRSIAERGDLAHLALFLWASGASGLLVWALREIARLNRYFGGDK